MASWEVIQSIQNIFVDSLLTIKVLTFFALYNYIYIIFVNTSKGFYKTITSLRLLLLNNIKNHLDCFQGVQYC